MMRLNLNQEMINSNQLTRTYQHELELENFADEIWPKQRRLSMMVIRIISQSALSVQ